MAQALKQVATHFSIGFTVSYTLYPHLGLSTVIGAAETVGAWLTSPNEPGNTGNS